MGKGRVKRKGKGKGERITCKRERMAGFKLAGKNPSEEEGNGNVQ